jgi:hypothetical protein
MSTVPEPEFDSRDPKICASTMAERLSKQILHFLSIQFEQFLYDHEEIDEWKQIL